MTNASQATAVIMGGSRGIGKATASLFLTAQPLQVWIVGRHTETVERAVTELRGQFGEERVQGTAVNLSDLEQVEQLSRHMGDTLRKGNGDDDVRKTFLHQPIEARQLRQMVYCAGVASQALLHRSTGELVDRVLDLNLKGAIHATRLFSRLMLRTQTYSSSDYSSSTRITATRHIDPMEADGTVHGHLPHPSITLLGSVLSLRARVGLSVYAASKAGLLGFVRTAAQELARHGQTVNVVEPGYTLTDMTREALGSERGDGMERVLADIPLHRLAHPMEIAKVIHFVATTPYMTGQVASAMPT